MALKKARVIAVTAPSGGTGKTTMVLCMAGIFSTLGKKVLIIDLDLYKGTISTILDVKEQSDIFKLVDDLNNNKFKSLDDYVTKYDDMIDVITACKDPRYANKVNASYLQLVFDKYINKYDLIIVDTSSSLMPINLITFDYSDLIVYVINNSSMDLKNMRTLVSIFKEMNLTKYRIALNNAAAPRKTYFSKTDIKNIIKAPVDYTIPKEFYLKNYDKYIMEGTILTLDKKIRIKNKGVIKMFDNLAKQFFNDIEDTVKRKSLIDTAETFANSNEKFIDMEKEVDE